MIWLAEGAWRMLFVVTSDSLWDALLLRDGVRALPVTIASSSVGRLSAQLFGQRSSRADRALRLCSFAVALWLTLTVSPVVRYARAAEALAPIITHLLALGIVCMVLVRDERAPQLLRDWLPLCFLPFLYLEARWPLAGIGRPHSDSIVQAWEALVFPSDPSGTLAVRLPGVALSEALHAAYLSYYGLLYLPPLVLYLRESRAAFAETMLALAVAFGVCFTTFLLFPVDGPRFENGAALAPNGPVRTLTLALLQGASTRGTAFPSSHVAASVVVTICALRFVKPMGYLLVALTAALMAATVYGGFHYAVDVVAGLLVGMLAVLLAHFIWVRL